jgi:hypothetical protein
MTASGWLLEGSGVDTATFLAGSSQANAAADHSNLNYAEADHLVQYRQSYLIQIAAKQSGINPYRLLESMPLAGSATRTYLLTQQCEGGKFRA